MKHSGPKHPMKRLITKRGGKHMIQVGPSDLPPPGHKRDEELRRRRDNLETLAAQMGEHMEVGSGELLDHIKEEREILHNIDSLNVSNALPEYTYAWVCEDYPSHAKGLKVNEKLTRSGWEIVKGDMPEARERIEVRSMRKLGDSILMRCRIDRELLNLRADRDLRVAQSESVYAQLEVVAGTPMGQKYIKVHLDMKDPTLQRLIKSHVAQQTASTKFDGMLRTGRVPGREINV